LESSFADWFVFRPAPRAPAEAPPRLHELLHEAGKLHGPVERPEPWPADVGAAKDYSGFACADPPPELQLLAAAAPAEWTSIELYVAAGAQAGLEPGCYSYDRRSDALYRFAPSRAGACFRACGLGLGRHEEPGYLVAVSVLPSGLAAPPERAYRLALLRAGGTAERLVARGRSTRVLTAFEDDALNAALGLDGVEEAVVIAVALPATAGA
jgi:hypothetical protein